MTRKPASQTPPLALQGDLDLFSIQAQWETVRAWLAGQPEPIRLDLTGVGDLDLSGIQLLLALDRQAAAQGAGLLLSGVRLEWAERFRTLGLASFLEDRP